MRQKVHTPKTLASTSLAPTQVFVFGSNLRGIHGYGVASFAYKHFGAKHGTGRGLVGRSYAFPMIDENIEPRSLADIEKEIPLLWQCAKENPKRNFLVTKLGCDLDGFTVEEIGDLFRKHLKDMPKNVIIPEEFDEKLF